MRKLFFARRPLVVDCSDPPPVPDTTAKWQSTGYKSKAYYTCVEGKWLAPQIYAAEVTCGPSAVWLPAPSSLRCEGQCAVVVVVIQSVFGRPIFNGLFEGHVIVREL